MTATQTVRCAIYTRKSSEEGLEQGFNSLDAQYEACAAYVLSQASEGWVLGAGRYDDGGVSGGTLERPGLQRLLADVAAGRIDTIVVYKVDRLSRSLFDFAKLVERFEAAGTSFVSITQSFNTTSSMGRLTLNMLLSFAQFEREVTAERIRDKIAASKAKGMWMGGVPPLGYRPDGRTLAIVEAQAALTRHIFQRYLVLGTVRRLAEELACEGRLSPVRRTAGGTIGGRPFSRGQLYLMLKCRTYLGAIAHRGLVHPGLHPAIVDRAVWDRVQAALAAHTQGSRDRTRAERPSLLAGRIVDEGGTALIASHASKASAGGGRVRYAYYISAALQERGSAATGLRLPAREVDGLVTGALAAVLADPLALIGRAGLAVPADALGAYVGRVGIVAARVAAQEHGLIRSLVATVRVLADRVEIDCAAAALAAAVGAAQDKDSTAPLRLTAPARLTRSGRALRLIAGGRAVVAAPDATLVRLLAKARGYWQELRQGLLTVSTLAAREQVSPAYITRVLRLAFLSPALTEAILAGTQPATLAAVTLLRTNAIAPSWAEQAALLGAAG